MAPQHVIGDDMGVRVFSLNELARTSHDELIGADAARMLGLASQLRTTALSPPPPSDDWGGECQACAACSVAPAPPPSAARAVGRVTVGNVATAPRHPLAVYGGRGSLLGNFLVMHNESQRDAACDGFAAVLGDASLDPYAVAGRLGLTCHPGHAAVSPSERWSFMKVLALKVARGRSLLLLCHCAPLRCHLDAVAVIVSRMAHEMRASLDYKALTTCSANCS